ARASRTASRISTVPSSPTTILARTSRSILMRSPRDSSSRYGALRSARWSLTWSELTRR
ncbi:hypothetical protein EV182_006382, partial [Spiromyces aspiralis]